MEWKDLVCPKRIYTWRLIDWAGCWLGHLTQRTQNNESKHSEMNPVRQNPIQRTVRSVHMCALHCAQLLYTILQTTDMIIFPLTLQTITTAPMMFIWRKGGVKWRRNSTVQLVNPTTTTVITRRSYTNNRKHMSVPTICLCHAHWQTALLWPIYPASVVVGS